MEKLFIQAQKWLALYGLKVLAGVAILVIGLLVVNYLTKMIKVGMTKARLDLTLVSFAANLLRFSLIAVVGIAALNQIGFQTTSLIAVLGGAVFAVGLALQSNLSSLASGVLILIFRPFRVGDIIETGGMMGTVEDIDILQTRIKCVDGRTVVVPNTKLTSEMLTNYSARPVMRADITIGISYGDDITKAKRIVAEVLAEYPKALKDPAPQIVVESLGDSSVNLGVRPFVGKDDFYQAKWDLYELIKLRFDQEGITIPFPQRDVHMLAPTAEPAEPLKSAEQAK